MVDCYCSRDPAVGLACSGRSNVGQTANEVARRPWCDGLANFVCPAGVGGHVSGMVASVEGSDEVLLLGGCPVGWAKKCMEAAGLNGYEYAMVTDLEAAREKTFGLAEADLERVVTECRRRLGAPVAQA